MGKIKAIMECRMNVNVKDVGVRVKETQSLRNRTKEGEKERENKKAKRHIVKAVTSATAATQTIIGLMSCDRFN